MILDFVRHAESRENAAHILQGQMDSPLSENGILQSESLRERLNPPYDLCFSSSLTRAKQTAYIALNVSDTNYDKVILLDELMEMNFGSLEGVKFEDFTEEQKIMWNNLKTIPDYKEHGGESGFEFMNRIMQGIEKIIRTAKNIQAKKILIITHGGVLRMIYRNYFPDEQASFENTVICSFTIKDGTWKINN